MVVDSENGGFELFFMEILGEKSTWFLNVAVLVFLAHSATFSNHGFMLRGKADEYNRQPQYPHNNYLFFIVQTFFGA